MTTIDLFSLPGGDDSGSTSPFDVIKRVDEHGEHWIGRDLMGFLGYSQWRRFEEAIERAMIAAKNAKVPDGQFVQVRQLADGGNLGPQQRADYRLTRYAAYLLAMNADSRKESVAKAQTYFAVRTREAEVAVPQQRQLPKSYPEALRELAATVEESERRAQRIAQLEPAAESWETLAAARGDYSVADAAKMLVRDHGIKIGRDRLFTKLREFGWVYRDRGDGRYRAYQTAVERGWLAELPKSHEHPDTGERVIDPPQIRVTVKGLGVLRERLASGGELESA